MRNIALVLFAAGIMGFALIARTGAKAVGNAELAPDLTLLELADFAIAEDEAVASAAIQRLRDAGQEGLDALFITHSRIAQRAVTHARCEQPETNRWRCAVDAVAQQRDAAFSRLYWHTDLEQAKAIAAADNKPILSLRLLGELHEEHSCANSRYFRTVLYADPIVADYLRDDYVLHWKSVRPVPRITIDMGDGRRIDRTITGNSVHYVLNSDGGVLDIIPGLWDATSFREVLNQTRIGLELTEALFVRLESPNEPTNQNGLLAEHAGTLSMSKWAPERPMLAQLGDGRTPTATPDAAVPAFFDSAPDRISAAEAAMTAPSKRLLEWPALNQVGADVNTEDAAQPLFSRVPSEVSLSRASQILMWQKRFGAAADPNNLEQHRAMQAMIATFRQSLAADTALNRDDLRPRARRWLANEDLTRNVEKLNERVYAELFLTLLDDLWMGLVPSDAYAGLANEGLIAP